MDCAKPLIPAPRSTAVTHLRQGALAFVGFGLLLTCWAATIGRYGGPDEPAHVLRAHAVAHGDLLGAPAAGLPPGYRTVTVPAGIGTGDPACYRHDPTVTSACATATETGPVTVATAAGTNPPLYYALVGLPPRFFGYSDDPLAYRLSAVTLVSLVLALAVTRLRLRDERRVLGAALITPSCWFLWGVVNPNSLEIALVALAATGIGYRRPLDRRDHWWISVPLAAAIAMRPIAVAWALALLVVVEVIAHRDLTRRQRLIVWAPPAVAVVSVMVWNAWSGLVVDDRRTAEAGSLFDAGRESLGGLPRSGAELVASMGWLEYWAPWLASAAWGGAVLVLAFGRPRPARGAWAVLAAALIAVPVGFEMLLYGRVGLIWQGRYSLPVVAIAVVIALGSITRPLPRVAVHAMSGLAAVGTIAAFWSASRRYATGTDGPWWFAGADRTSRWLGPGTWVTVFSILVAGATTVSLRRTAAPAMDQTM